MRPRLVFALILLLLLPIGIMAWFGFRLAADEHDQVERQVAALRNQRLADHAGTVNRILQREATRLHALTADFGGRSPDALRALTRIDPLAKQLFVTDAEGSPRFPQANGAASQSEQAFIERTRRIFDERALFHQQPPPDERDDNGSFPSSAARADAFGWYAWHWGNGFNLLFWRRLPEGGLAGAEIDPLGLLADIVAALPTDTDPSARIRLRDARGTVLYQWGGYRPAGDESSHAVLALDAPLESWHLEYLAPSTTTGSGTRVQLISALLGLAVLLVMVSVFVYREFTRSMREARQRVNFVNQVSHELKTPLTNIRLYAELLQEEVEDEGPAARRLSVIVAETRRLSRLIGNVLSLARGQRGSLQINRQSAVLDDCVREVLEQFRPSLDAAGLVADVRLAAPEPLPLDVDAVSQIIGNLLGNVEKYAAAGGRLEVVTRQDAQTAQLSVRDFGPGVPPSHRMRIFQPFYRVRSDVTEGVSGTGIGLSIARELARLHGGDLVLAEEVRGARFVLTIPRRQHEGVSGGR